MTDIRSLYQSLEYGPVLESCQPASDWLDKHHRAFGHFINGQFTEPAEDQQLEIRNPATGDLLAGVSHGQQGDVDAAVDAAHLAFASWSSTSPSVRARYLYALARNLQKHSRLLAVLETLNNGKPIRESRDIDIPLAIRHFYYHAGAAQIMENALLDRAPIGVCGQIIPWNFPLLMLAWKVAPAIAMGNTVVLKPAEFTPLTALLFADICRDINLPAGVINIVTGEGKTGVLLVEHPKINKIAFTGSTDVGRDIRRKTAGSGKSLTLELGGKSPYIVFEDADLDAAIEGLCDGIWFNQGQVCCAGSRLLVQESIATTFYRKLHTRMNQLRVGNPLDKCTDVGAIVHPVQLQRMTEMVETNVAKGQTIYQTKTELPPKGCYYQPTLITNLTPTSSLMQEEIFGPILVSTTFRTPAEAVTLANNTRYGLAASVWSESVNLVLDIAPKLECGVVWVNSTNLFDAAAEFGGRRESGFGREGGWKGLNEYTKFSSIEQRPLSRKTPKNQTTVPKHVPKSIPIDRTIKHYINGKQVRPDNGLSLEVRATGGELIGHVGRGNRRDLRNAVEAARKAQPNWRSQSGHARAQIIYFIAENLAAQSGSLIKLMDIDERCAQPVEAAEAEIESSCNLLFAYAAWADKFDGQVHAVPFRGLALAVNEPVGVVAGICPPNHGLRGFISIFAPLISMGNVCVLAVSGKQSVLALECCKILHSSDVPAGVINVVSGIEEELAPELAAHHDVDGIWHFGSPDLTTKIEYQSAANLKRTWTAANDPSRSLNSNSVQFCQEFLAHASDVKSIWVPYGE